MSITEDQLKIILFIAIFKFIKKITFKCVKQHQKSRPHHEGCQALCVFGPAFKARTRINFFTFKVRTFWQSEVKISVLALWLCALSSLFHNMGVGGMDVILSLYVPGMFRGVWKNVLTLNVLYTDLSSLWMPGRTHYTHVCILCPRFECRDR